MGLIADALLTLKATLGNDALLSLATVDFAWPQATAGERQALKEAFQAAAVPHWINAPLLAAVLGCEPAAARGWLEQLAHLPIVEPFPARGADTYNVHEASRLAVRRWLAESQPARFAEWSARAATHFEADDSTAGRIEWLTHLMCAGAERAADECERLATTWSISGRPEDRFALMRALDELLAGPYLRGRPRAEALVTVVEVRIERGSLAHLDGMAREALELFGGLPPGLGRARALCQLGDITLAAGQVRESEAFFAQYQQTVDALVAGDRSRLDWLHEKAVAYSRAADAFEARGAYDDALAALERSLVVIEDLAARQPAFAPWQRELAALHSRLGGIHEVQRRPHEALRAVLRTLDIAHRLVRVDPANANWLRELASAHGRVGSAREGQGKPLSALRWFRRNAALLGRLAEADPGDASLKRDLAVACSRLGGVHQSLAHFSEALAIHERGLEICRQLAEGDPRNVDLQQNLAIAHAGVGLAHESEGRHDEALRAFQFSLERYLELVARDPDNVKPQNDLAVAHYRVGKVLLAVERHEDALAAFESAEAVERRLVEREPDKREHQENLALILRRVGEACESLGRLDAAMAAYAGMRDLRMTLAESAPDDRVAQFDLSLAHFLLAGIHEAQGRPVDALGERLQDLAISERLVAADPENLRWRRELATTLSRVAALLQRLGETPRALTLLQRLVEHRRQLVARTGDAAGRQDLADALLRVAALHDETGTSDLAAAARAEAAALQAPPA